MEWLDNFFEKKTRSIAQNSSRRGALARIAKYFVGRFCTSCASSSTVLRQCCHRLKGL